MLLAQFFKDQINILAADYSTNRFAGDMRLGESVGNPRKSVSTFPDYFRFAGNTGPEIIDHSNATKFALVDHSDPVTKGLRIGKNVCGEKNGLAFVFQALQQLP